jgi:BirA family biotin operon repressor/biotin-[acetyl-CoA-carboxylase] ligase
VAGDEAAVHRLRQVPSTLDVLHDLAAGGARHGTVVVAQEQMQGRGTRGRTWHSPVGGLWFSILYRDLEPSGVECLSVRVGLAVARAVELAVDGARIELKWPNDLIMEDRKLGGILCEARWQGNTLSWIAVGLGLNVANAIPVEVAATAIRLTRMFPAVTPDRLIGPITEALRSLPLDRSHLSAEESAALASRDWLAGRTLREPVPGIARGIAPDGSLIVEQPDGQRCAVKAGRVGLD